MSTTQGQEFGSLVSHLLSSCTLYLTIEPQLNQAKREANGNIATDTLLERARKRLASLKQDENRMLPHPSDIPVPEHSKRVDPYNLLNAMLEMAPSEYGRRYVAAAICSCDNTGTLVELSNMWLRYLLIPLKGNRSLADFSPPSNIGTHPNRDSHLVDNGLSMIKLVQLRDGYRCPLTEYYHNGAAPPNGWGLYLEVAHIIKRALGIFDLMKDEGSLITWDILSNYMGWDAERVQEVVEELNTPLNGMLLEANLLWAWDNFGWTLKPVLNLDGTPVPDTYEVEEVSPHGFRAISKPDASRANRQIIFRDHGADPVVKSYMPMDDVKLITRSRPLPDRELISLHRALCWVLHMSGAGEVIDSIFTSLEYAGVQVPSEKIRTTDELDLLISTRSLTFVSS